MSEEHSSKEEEPIDLTDAYTDFLLDTVIIWWIHQDKRPSTYIFDIRLRLFPTLNFRNVRSAYIHCPVADFEIDSTFGKLTHNCKNIQYGRHLWEPRQKRVQSVFSVLEHAPTEDDVFRWKDATQQRGRIAILCPTELSKSIVLKMQHARMFRPTAIALDNLQIESPTFSEIVHQRFERSLTPEDFAHFSNWSLVTACEVLPHDQ